MKVLVIAAHPDDETLGCGGTLLKHKAAGDDLCWLIVTAAHEPEWSTEILGDKENEVAAVGSAYGFQKVFRLKFPTAGLDAMAQSEIITAIRGAVDEARPDWVYLNHASDIHSDHRVTFQAVLSALKPFHSTTHGVRRLLSYETLSSTEAALPDPAHSFSPNVFNNITEFIDRKLEIMSLYATEIQPYPLPRANESIRALARFRGASVGVEYAEAFMLLREVV